MFQVLFVILVLALPVAGWTAEPDMNASSIDSSDVFGDALTAPRRAVLEGKLVCLDCAPDMSHVAEMMKHCEEAGHRHGIEVRGFVYELRPTAETRKDIYSPDLFGRVVRVRGQVFRSREATVIGAGGTVFAASIARP